MNFSLNMKYHMFLEAFNNLSVEIETFLLNINKALVYSLNSIGFSIWRTFESASQPDLTAIKLCYLRNINFWAS